ncbi:MAG: DUF4236 domain-containing protein [Saprospiraceae bacterium]
MSFRRRIKVFPGFSLNFSMSGVSATVGPRGANINFSKRGTFLNTGIPGTGIYDRRKIGGSNHNPIAPPELGSSSIEDSPYFPKEPVMQPLEKQGAEIKSDDIEGLTSSNLLELKETLFEAFTERRQLPIDIQSAKNQLKNERRKLLFSRIFVYGLLLDSYVDSVNDSQFELECLEDQLGATYVDIDVTFDKIFNEKYLALVRCYDELIKCKMIWDCTSIEQIDRVSTRSAASNSLDLKPVRFTYENIDVIKSSYPAFHMENRNGGDLYIYPGFAIIIDDRKNFGLIDIKDLEFRSDEHRMITESEIPSDTQVVGHTWAKVNKDGSRDQRFVGNYEIPIVKYGGIGIASISGLNESYVFSNFEKSESFIKAFNEYKRILIS